MKNMKKVIPFVAALAMLAGCSNAPELSKKEAKKDVVSVEGVSVENFGDVFDDLYANSGISTATNELLKRVAEYVLNQDSYWQTNLQTVLDERVTEEFNSFYTSTYKEDGMFKEELLVKHLKEEGYDVKETEGKELFEETVTTLVGHKDLKTVLTADYSDYIESLEREMYVTLLKEQYIYEVKSTSNSNYYKNKDVRNVSYFTYTTDSSTDKNYYSTVFQNLVDENIKYEDEKYSEVTEFATFIERLEFEWKCKKLEDLAKEFAMINKAAFNGESKVNTAEYPLPSTTYDDKTYESVLKAAEDKWKNDDDYGFKDIYTAEGRSKLESDVISDARSKYETYSSTQTQSIYKGYYLKQLDIITADYLTEVTYTADSSNVINSTVTDVIEDLDSENKYKTTNYLDVNETNTVVYKSSSTNYIIYCEEVDVTTEEGKRLACKQLATSTSNVKNAIYYYLTKLTDEGKFSVHNQEVYDYLNETYSYGEEN